MTKFLQWNIRGLHANREELDMLLSHIQPSVVSLQETFLKENKTINFKGYSSFHSFASEINGTPHGGSAILVNSSVPHTKLNLYTSLQAVAIRVTCRKTITVCSIYLPPSMAFNTNDFYDLLHQLPPPILITGDFNSHSTLWGCTKLDRRGKMVEDILTKHNLCILNDASSTYIHPATGSSSAIDLSICSPDIFLDMQWKTLDDLCGSDHYPISISFGSIETSSAVPSWKLRKADWPSFSKKASEELGYSNPAVSFDEFSEKLITIAKNNIPKSKFSVRKHNTVWFNDTCKEAIKERKKALRKVKSSPTSENIQKYKVIRGQARRTIKTARRQSWQNFVSSINSRTSIKRVWNMINKISGKRPPAEVKHLQVSDKEITAVADIADTLADSFSEISSNKHYSPKFQLHKAQAERQTLKFNSHNMESYNTPFSIDELLDALSNSNDSAAGPDDIHYQMLKHLPSEVLNTLLNILNDIWITGNFPSSWRQSYVVPIPKPGKDASDPTNYRPIALTSCVCKVMERMVNSRLVWYLERNKIITPTQSGFRKGRSTTDQLVRLESFVREAFIQKQHATAIFFDLEKAYDTTWKFGILKDLHNAGLRGRLPLFIAGFLCDRKFQVRVAGSYSKLCEQETGVPQGSILSVTLFCLKINSIIKAICPGVDYSLYVDDFLICYRSKHIHIIERHLQRCLNKLQEWADTSGFKFSTAKTVCIHFCRLRKFHSDPQLLLNGSPIPVVEEVKFLGIIFDKKLSFLPHLRYLKDKCTKALNLLRVVAHTSWGADQQTLLHLYRSLIRSKLDYGCIVYGSTRGSYLQMLDPIQNLALRLCLGAYRTSPSSSLCVLANEPPLYIRRRKLSIQYCLKLSSSPQNPTHNTVFNCKFKDPFEHKPNQIPPLSIRVQPDLRAVGFVKRNALIYSIPATPPWLLKRPHINYNIHFSSKDNTSPEIYRNKFFEFCDHYKDFSQLYTDGSKMGNEVAAAVVHGNVTKTTRLPNKASIFRAELYAISLALSLIRRTKEKNFIIFSDSMSSLEAISGFKLEIDIVQNIIKDYTHLANSGKTIILCWIPSHVNIRGNERADTAAKSALSLPITNMKLPARELIPRVSEFCLDEWQDIWDCCKGNKLHSIYPTVGIVKHSKNISRFDSVLLNRLRIGHSRLTHSYLLCGDDPPTCQSCGTPLTVKHILVECPSLRDIREKYFSVSSVADLFKSVDNHTVINFIKETHFYHQL